MKHLILLSLLAILRNYLLNTILLQTCTCLSTLSGWCTLAQPSWPCSLWKQKMKENYLEHTATITYHTIYYCFFNPNYCLCWHKHQRLLAGFKQISRWAPKQWCGQLMYSWGGGHPSAAQVIFFSIQTLLLHASHQHLLEASVGLLRFILQKASAFAKNMQISSFTTYLGLCNTASFKAARQLPKYQLRNAMS